MVVSSRATRLTSEMIKEASGKYDVENVFMLTIRDAGIEDLGDIGLCCNLLDLDIHRNSIQDLSLLKECAKLERVNLSGNRITSLKGLSHLTALSYVHIQGNLVSDVSELDHLGPLKNLKALYLRNIDGSRSNPVCESEIYKRRIMELCPQLDILDGERLRLKNDFYKIMAEESNSSPRSKHSRSQPEDGDQETNEAGNRDVPKPWIDTKEGEGVVRSPGARKEDDFDASLEEVCEVMKSELKTCSEIIADVDMFLRLRGVDMKKKRSPKKTSKKA